ncbi:MAG: cell division topological specificity factor MinE [Helicobacteraceae bacterium]|jgi:cell division topological specificity factor MinE|nr:cell division topological specificity factor MinE [Helicobacteraceae bacterium]
MSFLSDLFGQKKSASVAKNRLIITLEKERANASFDFIDQMKEEILFVIKRYINASDIRILAKKNQHIDRLEIEIDLENGK